MAGDTLDQLEEQEKQLQAKLTAVKKTIEDKRNRLNIAVGVAVLAEAEANAAYKSKLMKVLDKNVKGKRSRAMLGLDEMPAGDHRVTGD